MNPNKLYFYRKVLPLSNEECEKRGCKFFDHAKGVAGFKEPQSNMQLYLYGTLEELEEFLKHRKLSMNTRNDLSFVKGRFN